MSSQLGKDIGAHVKVALGIAPQSISGATVEGDAVDRAALLDTPQSGVLYVNVGAGTVTSVDAKVEQSADGATGWTDLEDTDGNTVEITQLTAQDTQGFVDFKLDGAQRYIRASVTVVGTSVLTSAEFVLGGAEKQPAA